MTIRTTPTETAYLIIRRREPLTPDGSRSMHPETPPSRNGCGCEDSCGGDVWRGGHTDEGKYDDDQEG